MEARPKLPELPDYSFSLDFASWYVVDSGDTVFIRHWKFKFLVEP